MSGIGNPYQVQSISNCFVIESPYDSYGGILKADQELVQIAKRRGGVGFDLSTIRPQGFSTANCAKTTDGIEVFMDRFSNSWSRSGPERPPRRADVNNICSSPTDLRFYKN